MFFNSRFVSPADSLPRGCRTAAGGKKNISAVADGRARGRARALRAALQVLIANRSQACGLVAMEHVFRGSAHPSPIIRNGYGPVLPEVRDPFGWRDDTIVVTCARHEPSGSTRRSCQRGGTNLAEAHPSLRDSRNRGAPIHIHPMSFNPTCESRF